MLEEHLETDAAPSPPPQSPGRTTRHTFARLQPRGTKPEGGYFPRQTGEANSLFLCSPFNHSKEEQLAAETQFFKWLTEEYVSLYRIAACQQYVICVPVNDELPIFSVVPYYYVKAHILVPLSDEASKFANLPPDVSTSFAGVETKDPLLFRSLADENHMVELQEVDKTVGMKVRSHFSGGGGAAAGPAKYTSRMSTLQGVITSGVVGRTTMRTPDGVTYTVLTVERPLAPCEVQQSVTANYTELMDVEGGDFCKSLRDLTWYLHGVEQNFIDQRRARRKSARLSRRLSRKVKDLIDVESVARSSPGSSPRSSDCEELSDALSSDGEEAPSPPPAPGAVSTEVEAANSSAHEAVSKSKAEVPDSIITQSLSHLDTEIGIFCSSYFCAEGFEEFLTAKLLKTFRDVSDDICQAVGIPENPGKDSDLVRQFAIQLSVHSYLFNGVHQKVWGCWKANFREADESMRKCCDALRQLDLAKILGFSEEAAVVLKDYEADNLRQTLNPNEPPDAFRFGGTQPSSEEEAAERKRDARKLAKSVGTLADMSTKTNPYEMLRSLKATLDNLGESMPKKLRVEGQSADLMLPLLIYAFLRSRIGEAETLINYLTAFQFDEMADGPLGYALASLEATIYYIKQEGAQKSGEDYLREHIAIGEPVDVTTESRFNEGCNHQEVREYFYSRESAVLRRGEGQPQQASQKEARPTQQTGAPQKASK